MVASFASFVFGVDLPAVGGLGWLLWVAVVVCG